MNTDKIIAESIAKEYAPKSTSKLTALRKLDRKAKQPAAIFTYIFGTISSLVAGREVTTEPSKCKSLPACGWFKSTVTVVSVTSPTVA